MTQSIYLKIFSFFHQATNPSLDGGAMSTESYLSIVALITQGQYFGVANTDFAAWVMLLESEVAIFKAQPKIVVLVEFLTIDHDFYSSHLTTAPNIILYLQFIVKPGAGFNQLLINMSQTIKRAGANGVYIGAVNLCFIAISIIGLFRRSKIEPRVSAFINVNFSANTKVFVRSLSIH